MRPHIYVGIKGTVLALHHGSGEILWQTSVGGWNFVSVVSEGDRVFALSNGEAYCLDATTGLILWHNPLKGFGYGLGSLAVAGTLKGDAAAAAQWSAEQESSSHTSAGT